ncbi:ethanolamine permease [Hamadaea flava]|uniref:Ethanolamine permease n=1 Tax=Hamadaea flava TaxID=1742688 RepID=A0ABV8M0G5_9ACTN|nr:ethanolamine permease [Hamadaea flava]MCP2324471.1 ethanolamine permease [Hamadaea flava]
MAGQSTGGVTYREADGGYFAQRALRRHAGVWSLWALGVAAVISGEFSGWNLGLDAGGFGGLLVATVVISVMYFGLCFSIAEMSPALPHTGGAYSFARSAMGPWGGFITGVAESIEYIVTPAVVVTFIGSYLQSIVDDLVGVSIPQPVWWLICYAIFLLLNLAGIEMTMRFTVVICVLALAILAVFFVAAIPDLDFSANALNIAPDPGNSSWFPFGVFSGVFLALPFAIWFFLAIEELPLAAEESHDPRRDIPRGTVYGLLTLLVAAFGVLFLNTGIKPGAEGLRDSGEPLLDGFKTIFGQGTSASLLGLVAVAGLVASFHTIIYAYGRNVYSLSRAGYYPHVLSITHGKRKTPWVALLGGGVLGYALALLLYLATENKWLGGNVSAALLSMAVFGGVISYFMQMLSFILLRRRLPGIERPYRSPLGIAGAAVAGVIALISLAALFVRDDYRPGVVGVAIWFVAAIAYFAVAGRHKLILSPEEEFAMTRGEHGRPDRDGYGQTHVSDLTAQPEAPVAAAHPEHP